MKKKTYISIEEILFGDFRVNVWDEQLNSALDREYFCRGYESALATAVLVQSDFFPYCEIRMSPGDITINEPLVETENEE